MEKECVICGEKFEVWRRPDQKYCSPECRAIGRAEDAREARALYRQMRQRQEQDND